MLTETEAEEIIVFFETFSSLVASNWGPGPPAPPSYTYALRKFFAPSLDKISCTSTLVY